MRFSGREGITGGTPAPSASKGTLTLSVGARGQEPARQRRYHLGVRGPDTKAETREPRPEPGFTLLEVLIAMTILAMIVTIVMTTFSLGMKAWETGEERNTVAQRLRIISDIVGREIRSAKPSKFKDKDDKDKFLFCLKHKKLDFISTSQGLVLDQETDKLGIREVSFYVDDSGSTPESGLVMRESSVSFQDPFNPDRGILVEIDDSVTDIDFELIPAYDPQQKKFLKMSNFDWCYPDADDPTQTATPPPLPFTIDPQTDRRIQNMIGNELPLAIIVTLTLRESVEEGRTEKLPPMTFPMWNSRVFEFPRSNKFLANP